eukprot:1139538-Pelagomonas_calceolata.AAC.4
MPLFWKELTRVTDLGIRCIGYGWRLVLPVSLASSLTSQQVLKSKMICTANVHGGKACPKWAFADTFKENSAGNSVALSYHICHAGMLTSLSLSSSGGGDSRLFEPIGSVGMVQKVPTLKYSKCKTFSGKAPNGDKTFFTYEVFIHGGTIMKFNSNVGYVNKEDYVAAVHAFSHWTWHVTGGRLMVVDVQHWEVVKQSCMPLRANMQPLDAPILFIPCRRQIICHMLIAEL